MRHEPDSGKTATIGHDCVRRETDQLVVFVRLELYNRGLPCGPKALRAKLTDHYGVCSPPSERTIARILARNGLTHGRTGWYAGEERRGA